jgi:hypothetical protein
VPSSTKLNVKNNIIFIFKSTFTKTTLNGWSWTIRYYCSITIRVIQLRLHFVLGFPPQLFRWKKIYVDCTKLSVIAKVVGGSRGLGFQNKLKDEVVIVTDAKLEIVFASHNMTKMNGYVRVIGRSQKCFKVILLMY